MRRNEWNNYIEISAALWCADFGVYPFYCTFSISITEAFRIGFCFHHSTPTDFVYTRYYFPVNPGEQSAGIVFAWWRKSLWYGDLALRECPVSR
ncbi:hypothetical protein BVRB_4g089280 [Beta vulgaris subsp. vulgaris]|nr:hypothetical protein BVRB_4g089280 [Beta vulgaris subsp. vulgaris]